MERLTLAFWYSAEDKYAESALKLLRTYFLDPSTGLKPNLDYAQAVPGLRQGSASGMSSATFRWNTRLVDSVELLKRSALWTSIDEQRWSAWSRAWLDYLHTSEFGHHQEELATNNHATWMFVHKIAFAYAVGNSSVGLQTLQSLRVGLPGSLVNQIAADGAMPHELKRTWGATYTRMNLKALFYLGVVAERVCAAWSCPSRYAWDWEWQAPKPTTPGSWKVTKGKVSKCPWVSTIRNPASTDACKKACRRADANAFHSRWRPSGSIGDCACKRCSSGTGGMLEDPPQDKYAYDAHVFEEPVAEGAGSVKKALDFVLPYAIGDKRFKLGKTMSSDASKPWKDLAPLLRLAATVYEDDSYEETIPKLLGKPGEDFALKWPRDFFNLLWPAPEP
mmetsp:Transcript_88179/g.213832  ORF Transcript_88179/g.213832 Transcript_88179/m.213832 type:complete len:392 (-) Transcript_88179:17-1192(-)